MNNFFVLFIRYKKNKSKIFLVFSVFGYFHVIKKFFLIN